MKKPPGLRGEVLVLRLYVKRGRGERERERERRMKKK